MTYDTRPDPDYPSSLGPYTTDDHPTVPAWPHPPITLPPTPSRPRRSFLLAFLAGALAILILGGVIFGVAHFLRAHPSALSTTRQTLPVATATHPVTATNTPGPTTCAALPAFVQATPVSTKSSFFLPVPFPTNTVANSITTSETDGFAYRLLSACTSHMTSSTDLQATYAQAFNTSIWKATTPQEEQQIGQMVGQGCSATGCWTTRDTSSTSPAVAQFLNLEQIQTTGSLATYTIRLTIAPLFAETDTITQGTTFPFEHTGIADLEWTDTLHPYGNALAGLLDVEIDQATYTYITTTYLKKGLIGTISVIPLKVNTAIVLKDNRGHYAKFIIQDLQNNQMTLHYIVYAYGF